MNIFPVAIDDVFDAVEDPPPLPDDSPPGKDSQLRRNHVPVDSSSNVGTPASRKHYSQNNRNTSTSLHSERSKSYTKDVVSSDSRESGLSSDCGNNEASSSDISALTKIPQLSSPTWKKRRHRGRHRQHSDNVMVTGSPQDGPSPRTAANGSSTSLSTVPSAASFRDTDPAGFSKSASCGSWSFMGMVSDPVSCGLESSSTETAHLASPDTADSPTTTTCSSTPPKDQHSLTKRSWYTQALPFFSVSLGGDDDVTEERGMPVPHPNIHGPSAYIPVEELPSLGTFNEQTHMLFVDAFLQNNRLDHVTQVMGYHPTYLDVFLRTQNFILRGDGPLPYDYRHFIAIMAAGRHQCSYLISLQKQEFLLQGGDHTWLKGLSRIPQKLRDLYEINKILAHRPWLLTKSHIEKLTKGKDSWSLAEVVHAIVLLAHFHCLSSFVFGCGVNEELDQDGGHHNGSSDSAPPLGSSPRSVPSPTPLSTAPSSRDAEPWLASMSPVEQEVGVDMLMQRMKSLSERSEEFSQEEKTKRFEHVESQSVELSPGLEPLTQVKADIGHFVDDPTFLYQDFARRGEVSDIPTFRVQDYSWDDHGYSLVNRLYNDVGNLLDEKFKTASNLTYYTMGGRKDVDTSRFRRAIWNYIQCMYGIRHDDYDYGEVNQLLEKSLKTFIKSVCCYPERVTKKDYDRVLREFRHSEKVHVNLMVLEARMQAELLYALRAIMRYMT